MYDLAMSSNASGGEITNSDASYLGPVADVDYLTDVSDLDFDESSKGGLGAFLMKGGTFCLIAALMFTGYQFVSQDDSKEKVFVSNSLHDWEKSTQSVADNSDFLVAVERRFAENKTVDMTVTGSTDSKGISNLINKDQARANKPERKLSKAEMKAAKGKMYIVQAGDTLSKIALMFKTSSKTIIAMNDIENPSLIRPGMRLVVTK